MLRIKKLTFLQKQNLQWQRIVFSDSRENLVELGAVELTRGSTAQIDGFDSFIASESCLNDVYAEARWSNFRRRRDLKNWGTMLPYFILL